MNKCISLNIFSFFPYSLTQATTVNVFSGKPLGIFQAKETNYGTKLDVWEQLSQREVTLATSQPPANYFQKMILWTEQGKVWKFPIDNEQGMLYFCFMKFLKILKRSF